MRYRDSNQFVTETLGAYHILATWITERRIFSPKEMSVCAPNVVDDIILRLLGYASITGYLEDEDASSKAIRLSEMLTGPHGWDIYKTLEAHNK